MPKMSSVRKAISMTRSDCWTTTAGGYKVNSNKIADFCLNHCPHQNEKCRGDCQEMKEFRSKLRYGN